MADLRPTQAGFLTFIRDVMGIPAGALPDNSIFIPLAFDLSVEVVLLDFQRVSALIYQQMVYNLGGSYLLHTAQDQPPGAGVPAYDLNGVSVGYFTYVRTQFGMNSFTAGVLSETHDEATGQSMVVADWFKNATLANLQALQDPYGRAYLSWAQSAGALWGCS